MTGNLCRSLTAFVLAGVTVVAPVAPVYGQNQQPPATPPIQTAPATPAAGAQPPGRTVAVPSGPDYSIPKPYYWNFLLPYTPRQIPVPQYVNSPGILQMIQNGKLNLSLQDAIELALENNPDIAVQRYNSWIAETDIMRTKGGGAQRGAGGAVTTTTSFGVLPTISFDPTLSLSTSVDSRVTPSNNPLTSGLGTAATTVQSLGTHTETVNLGYTQGFHTGTTMAITFADTRSATTSPSVFFNPSVQSIGTLSFVQPLLNGFGLLVNERSIRIAIITKKAVDYAFMQSLITDITAVEDDYWELVFARGNVSVQQQAVMLAQQLYNDNERQVQVGTLAPLEIIRAEAQLATAQQALITAQTAQIQQQIVLMNVITKNPVAPELQNIEVVPTDAMQVPPPVEDIALTDAVNEAIADRPDVLILKTNLDADDINIKATRNALLPTLNLSGFVSSVGLSGDNKITGPGAPALGAPETVSIGGGPLTTLQVQSTPNFVTGINGAGFPAAFTGVFAGNFPEFEAQLSLGVPIRNRVAQADSARAGLNQRQDVARYQQGVNNAAVDVQNALTVLKQDRAALIAAQKSLDLQQQTLDADEKRLAVGATTNFVVVTDQQNLANAGAAEVRAQANLSEALVNFERAMARTLNAHGITVANAKTGTTPRDRLIPGTASNGELIGLKQAQALLPNNPK